MRLESNHHRGKEEIVMSKSEAAGRFIPIGTDEYEFRESVAGIVTHLTICALERNMKLPKFKNQRCEIDYWGSESGIMMIYELTGIKPPLR